jgi:hypothetical protein
LAGSIVRFDWISPLKNQGFAIIWQNPAVILQTIKPHNLASKDGQGGCLSRSELGFTGVDHALTGSLNLDRPMPIMAEA